MYYITTRQKEIKEKQITWLDIINDVPFDENLGTRGSAGTVTRAYESIPSEYLRKINVPYMIKVLEDFIQRHENLYRDDMSILYRHFSIPKKKGGLRPIDQPCDELQDALLELKNILADRFGILYHTSAFAYVPGRSTIQETYKHQKNESNWFLKTDFSGFFPNTTMAFTMNMLKKIFPTCEICKTARGEQALSKALYLGFLHDGLPQGTKLSPWLTNAIMIPLDYEMFNYFAHKRMVYTRYADDICISCVQRFDMNEAIKFMKDTMNKFGAPWKIKPEKTKFGSNKASSANWILGCNLNKDNNITVGWANKKLFKVMTTNIMLDYKHGNVWPIEDVRHYQGLLSYYMMVEKEYFINLIKHFEDKFGVKLETVLKASLSA